LQAPILVDNVKVDNPAWGRITSEPVQSFFDRLIDEEYGEIIAHPQGDGIAEVGRLTWRQWNRPRALLMGEVGQRNRQTGAPGRSDGFGLPRPGESAAWPYWGFQERMAKERLHAAPVGFKDLIHFRCGTRIRGNAEFSKGSQPGAAAHELRARFKAVRHSSTPRVTETTRVFSWCEARAIKKNVDLPATAVGDEEL